MFQLVSPARLDRYAAKIQAYDDELPDTWGLIYQTDVRARLEVAPNTREDLEREYAHAIVNNQATEYNPEFPWDGVFERLVSGEKDFWEKSLDKPGFRISSGKREAGPLRRGGCADGGTVE